MIGVVAGYGLLAAGGHGLLRLASGQRPHRVFGVLGALALSWLAGVATLAAVTTLVGVLGGRTAPLPVTAPVLGLLAVGGLLPPRRPAGAGQPPVRGWPPGRAVWLSDVGCGLVAAAVGVWTAAIAARVPVWRNDEAAIWMVRARALSQLGRLDPRVFVETAAGYQHQEYPLLIPSLAAWGDRWAGHPSDAAAHLGQAILLAALLAVTGWATGRLAGPLPALASVALVAAVPTMLGQATHLMADVPVLAFGLSTALVLLLWLSGSGTGRPLLAAAGALAAGACATKVEGTLFAGAAFLAALLLAPRRGGLLLAGAMAVIVNLPWVVYTRAHHIRSWAANQDTLSLPHLRSSLPFTGHVIAGMARRWPGHASPALLLLLAALVPAALVAARAGAGRIGGYLTLLVAAQLVGLVVQYVLTASSTAAPPTLPGLDSHLDITVYRVTLVPAALLMIAAPLLAGCALRPAGSARPEPVDRPPAEGDGEVGAADLRPRLQTAPTYGHPPPRRPAKHQRTAHAAG